MRCHAYRVHISCVSRKLVVSLQAPLFFFVERELQEDLTAYRTCGITNTITVAGNYLYRTFRLNHLDHTFPFSE